SDSGRSNSFNSIAASSSFGTTAAFLLKGIVQKSGKNDTSNFFVGLLFRCSRINCIRSAAQSYAASNFSVLFILLLNTYLKNKHSFIITQNPDEKKRGFFLQEQK